MYEIITINLLAVLCAYITRYREFRQGLKVSFIIIYIFLAIRFNFGNDYKDYYEDFFTLNRYTSVDFFNNSFSYEPGWLFLCRVFQPVGFFGMVMFLALFNCFIYYKFVKRWVPEKYWWLAVFIYVFNPDFMLIHASAMRQSVAISFFLISIPYIYKKDFIRCSLCIAMAWLFHSSSIVLLPVYLIGMFSGKVNRTWSIVIFAMFLSLFLYGNLFLPSVNVLISGYFERYEVYQGTRVGLNAGFGVFLFSTLLIFTLYFSTEQVNENNVLFKLAILSFMFIPMGLFIILISRIGMYFTPTTIAVYPIIVSRIKKPSVRLLFSFFVVVFTLYGFSIFFNSPVFKRQYENYHTIFSAPAKW